MAVRIACDVRGNACNQAIAWRAVHIACDVGNRVHTRNDSDEDVRGNACNQAIAWRALPWSFITQANAHGYLHRQSNNQFYYKNP